VLLTKGYGAGSSGVAPQEDLDTKNEHRKAVWAYLRNEDNTYCPRWKPEV